MHSAKRDCAPELMRGSQGSGCDRPAFEGPLTKPVMFVPRAAEKGEN